MAKKKNTIANGEKSQTYMRAMINGDKSNIQVRNNIFEPYQAPDGVIGEDYNGETVNDSYMGGGFRNFNITNDPALTLFEEGIGFPGYPYLSQLSLRVEYRLMVTTRAQELTRAGISFEFIKKDDNKEDDNTKLEKIEAEFKRLDILNLVRRHLEKEAYFGISHIYINLQTAQNDPEEKQSPLFLTPKKIKKGELIGFTLIEPIWTTPVNYNSINPFADDFYQPSVWWILGQQIHTSRLITTVTQPVPDILRPAFNFGGISFAFMCKPYVDNWLRTRQSVSDLIKSFSTMVLKTDLSQLLSPGCEELSKRAELMAAYRDNRGLQIVDKESEDLTNVSTSLSSLDKLQAQSQEHMSAASGIPLVKLLGITPSGLNASSDGEMRAFYDRISAMQESDVRPVIKTIFDVVQLSLFGEIDKNITFTFNPLWQLDELQQSEVNKNNVAIVSEGVNSGIISNQQAIDLLKKMDLPFADGVSLDKAPEQPQGGGDPFDGD